MSTSDFWNIEDKRIHRACRCALVLVCAMAIGVTGAFGAEGFLPLQSNRAGHMADMVLIYQGGQNRLSWTADQLAPYVSWKRDDSSPEEWLFDGFLFIEFRDGRGGDYAAGYKGKPARQIDWRWLYERNFSRTNGLGALDRVIGETIKRLGSPAVSRKVVLTLPEPISGQTNWGSVNGKALDFNLAADRITACEWQMDMAQELWAKAGFQNLRLVGFYWVAEQAAKAQDILPSIGRAVRKRGFELYWIPYWKASGAAQWQELGFDYAWQQPNHFFHPGTVPDERLGEATAFARAHGLGLEFEFDARAIRDAAAFRPRFYEYLKAFRRDGVESAASVAYYEGGGALLECARSKDPEVHAMYDALCRWVSDRQRTLRKHD